MYSRRMVNHSDDVEFDDLEEFDYVEHFSNSLREADDEDDYYPEDIDDEDDDYDDLEDIYADEEDEDDAEEDDFDDDLDSEGNEIEITFTCEDCGHIWVESVSEDEEENDTFEIPCPMCGSLNISTDQ